MAKYDMTYIEFVSTLNRGKQKYRCLDDYLLHLYYEKSKENKELYYYNLESNLWKYINIQSKVKFESKIYVTFLSYASNIYNKKLENIGDYIEMTTSKLKEGEVLGELIEEDIMRYAKIQNTPIYLRGGDDDE